MIALPGLVWYLPRHCAPGPFRSCKLTCSAFAADFFIVARSSSSGMCSKCYRESQAAAEAIRTPQHLPAAAEAAAPVQQLPAQPEPVAEASSPAAAAAEPEAAPEQKPVSKTRCQVCRKKVGLTGFKCKCSPDAVFCGTHRYAEAHECCFDYKAAAAKKIAAANPVVQAAKVEKI